MRRKITTPLDYELFGSRVEVAFAKGRWIDGVEELPQFTEANLNHSEALRELVAHRRRIRRLRFLRGALHNSTIVQYASAVRPSCRRIERRYGQRSRRAMTARTRVSAGHGTAMTVVAAARLARIHGGRHDANSDRVGVFSVPRLSSLQDHSVPAKPSIGSFSRVIRRPNASSI